MSKHAKLGLSALLEGLVYVKARKTWPFDPLIPLPSGLQETALRALLSRPGEIDAAGPGASGS